MEWAFNWQGRYHEYKRVLELRILKDKDREPDVLNFELYIDAFKELESCRPSSMDGLSPIPFTAIVEYSKIFPVGDFEEFLYLIRRMDDRLIKLQQQKAKAKPRKK